MSVDTSSTTLPSDVAAWNKRQRTKKTASGPAVPVPMDADTDAALQALGLTLSSRVREAPALSEAAIVAQANDEDFRKYRRHVAGVRAADTRLRRELDLRSTDPLPQEVLEKRAARRKPRSKNVVVSRQVLNKLLKRLEAKQQRSAEREKKQEERRALAMAAARKIIAADKKKRDRIAASKEDVARTLAKHKLELAKLAVDAAKTKIVAKPPAVAVGKASASAVAVAAKRKSDVKPAPAKRKPAAAAAVPVEPVVLPDDGDEQFLLNEPDDVTAFPLPEPESEDATPARGAASSKSKSKHKKSAGPSTHTGGRSKKRG